MFERNAVAFLYAVSPVHMGAGTATGLVDNPIQRERHTRHPSFAGSGIKGAVRHAFKQLGGDKRLEDRIFGPPARDPDLHAGAISFGDAQLVLFPVRSLRGGFVHATSPWALARAQRLLSLAGVESDWAIPVVRDGACVVVNKDLLDGGRLVLEVFDYEAKPDPGAVATIAAALAALALPPPGGTSTDAYKYFRDKIASDMVVLSDGDFTHFVENATFVEPHVRINPETGSADDGGLFYTENLPPEAVMIASLHASKTRSGSNGDGDGLDASSVMSTVRSTLNGKLVQIGGDVTAGRGHVLVQLHAGAQA